jgi:prepilin-type N-terminal cleavage/methylation domain-containing protein/prepilin-type processing-associated H-X9-DG protein
MLAHGEIVFLLFMCIVRFPMSLQAHSSRRPLHGFTLVELLVVIAIIGVLIGLLLPAVQAARESARRSSCLNNVKQLGLAVHGHHDGLGRLPPSGAYCMPPFGKASTASWGFSCFPYLLPYMEEQALYDKFIFDNGQSITPTYTRDNPMSPLRCPSSPMKTYRTFDSNKIAKSSYVPVRGAANGLIPGFTAKSAGTAAGGIGSKDGMLYVSSELKFKDCVDGTSKTIVMAEQSDYLIDTSGAQQEWSSSAYFGWPLGAYSGPNDGAHVENYTAMTIRYRINDKNNSGAGWTNGAGGIGNNSGNNSPINSPHPGGAHVLFLDGATAFLNQSTALQTLAQLATRNDGQVINE